MATYKRLYRSRDQRMVAGVAGGIGEYFNIDPTLVRLLFVVGALFGGQGLIAYLIMLVIVPEEPGLEAPPPPASPPVETEPPGDVI